MMFALTLCGLLGGPAFAGPPEIEVPEFDEPFRNGDSGVRMDTPWWRVLGDETLTLLIETAMSENYDLRAARHRLAQVDAVSWQTMSPLFPAASFDLSSSFADRNSSAGFQCQLDDFDSFDIASALSGDTTDVSSDELCVTGNANLAVSWMVDWTGRQALEFRASRVDKVAGEGDADALALLVTKSVGETWLDAVASGRQLQLIEQQIETGNALLGLIEMRYRNGDVAALDVLQQQQQAAATEAQLPTARAQLRATEYRLGVLLGDRPGAALPDVAADLPELPSTPPTGSPAELMKYRPDLRAAFERTRAARMRSTAATLALFPTLGLSASVGWQSNDLSDMEFDGSWSSGATLSVPIFNGARTWAGIKLARASLAAAEDEGVQSVLLAIEEVEGALLQDKEQRNRLDAVRRQVEAAQRAFDTARAQYVDGIGNYLSVMTSWSSVQQAELAEISAHRQALGAWLQLHHVLGARWAIEPRDTSSDGVE